MSDDNGTSNGRIYVRFGSGETQQMPIEWAEAMLREWRDRQPNQFGKALAEAATKAK